ncbi:hypothetical protein LTS10_001742 [Elasticomyces elasticus]|nr:hypothetical protein LTS10_001742 [Elasticomyces elasticus]
MDHYQSHAGPLPRPARHLQRALSGLAAKLDQYAGIELPLGKPSPSNDFYSQLGKLLPKPRPGQPPPRGRLRDAEFNKIASICDFFGKCEWSLRPRTFVVLYMIGHEELIEDFVREDLYDICLPYNATNLPGSLTGEARALFLDYQENVLTGQGAKLERSGHEHQHIHGSADDLFISGGLLGRGGSALVDRVMGKMTGEIFARKRIRRDDYRVQDQQRLALFENELKLLKSLSHKHIVKVVGSYTDSKEVGLIMLPVAEKNLATFLGETLSSGNDVDRRVRIRSYFGCIATALEYLHAQGVRHKDIKPQNILVKERQVYITDFGTSYHRKEGTSDTTEGTLKYFTRKYVAPETALGSRNKSSDIWSLGCVYLEMCTVLAGKTLSEMSFHFQAVGKSLNYYENRQALVSWSASLRETLLRSDVPEDVVPLDLVLKMCDLTPAKRPTARELIYILLQAKSPVQYHDFCCGREHWQNPSMPENCRRDDERPLELPSDDLVEDPTVQHQATEPEQQAIRPTVEDAETTFYGTLNEPPKLAGNLLEDVTELVVLRSPQTKPHASGIVSPSPASVSHAKLPATQERRTTGSLQPPTIVQGSAIHTGRDPSSWENSETNRYSALLDLYPTFANGEGLCGVRFHSPNALPCPWPYCKPRDGLALLFFDSLLSLQRHLRAEHHIHDIGLTMLASSTVTDGHRPTALTSETGALITRPSPKTHGKAREQARRKVQFGSAPAQQDPTRRECSPQSKNDSRGHRINADMPTSPDSTRLGGGDKSEVSRQTRGSMVPSYSLVLYGHRRFTLQGRRLAYMRPTADMSDRSEDGSAITKTDDSSINGFLVFGLSDEAIACLRSVYEKGGSRGDFYDDSDKAKIWRDNEFQAQTMTVCISTAERTTRRIEATTFVPYDDYDRFESRGCKWDLDAFVKSRTYTRLSSGNSRTSWVEEEQSIADSINVAYIQVGDDLVNAVMQNDTAGLAGLLAVCDVDAPSTRYGTALQAAAYGGHLAVMDLLIASGADIDAEGGEYGCALTAAVAGNQFQAARILLRHHATLFIPGGRYVSALYQAVSFEDVHMTHMLLEKGAWLTNNYGELLDMAAEHSNAEMTHELEQYDVRMLKQKRFEDEMLTSNYLTRNDTRQGTKRSLIQKPSTDEMGMALICEALRLKGQEGKWSGIKGVKLMQIALHHGWDPKHLITARRFIHTFPGIQSFLANTMSNASFGKSLRPVQHTYLDKDVDDRNLADEEVSLAKIAGLGVERVSRRLAEKISHKARSIEPYSRPG